MKKRRRSASILAASTPASGPTPPAEREIRALRAASNRAIATRDLPAISATLADDFVVIIGDGTLLTRPAYLEAFAHTFAQPLPLRYERIADTIHISASLPLAAEHGHWIGTVPDGTVLFTGTYMAMWRNSAAGWRLRSELFVTLN
jgi:ketosteroid isomerase-like protein